MTKASQEPFDFWHSPATISANNFKYKSLSNWACNIAVGCSHACRFCYVPSTATIKQGSALRNYGVHDPDEQWGAYSLLRPWDEKVFLASLKRAQNTPESSLKSDGNRAVMFCSTTDPYQVFTAQTPAKSKLLNDAALAMVERALVAIRDHSNLNVRILTRSPLARSHFDLYRTFGNRLAFGVSLPTLNNKLARVYEPKAPAPSRRLQTLQEAKKAGLHVFVALAPSYPECDEVDLRQTLAAVKGLAPITVFHEPINIRSQNVARIEQHAKAIGVKVNTAVFADSDAWRTYAIGALLQVQHLATEMGMLDYLHLWPDPALASKPHFMRIRRKQRTGLTPPQKHLALLQDEKDYDTKYLPWLTRWWHRISEWPGHHPN